MSSPIEFENSSIILNPDISDNELHLEFQKLHSKVKELEREKKEISDNYDTQRAKLCKIYSQKEEELKNVRAYQVDLESEIKRLNKELDDAKSQIYIAGILNDNEFHPEIQKAQANVSAISDFQNGKHFKIHNYPAESMEFTTSQSELKKSKQGFQTLECQSNKSKAEKEKEGILLASSNVLSSAKSLAKKFVGQLGNDPECRSHEIIEDTIKKAQEEREILQSVFISPERRRQELEGIAKSEERKKTNDYSDALSPSGQTTNEKSLIDLSFNSSRECGVVSSKQLDSNISLMEGDTFDLPGIQATGYVLDSSRSASCDMCVNYEAQLVAQQLITDQVRKQKDIIEGNMERFKEDLIKETQFRKCMEDKWNEKKEEHKLQVNELKSMYEIAENNIKRLQDYFKQVQEDVKKEMQCLRFDREKINKELLELQHENNNLMGKYKAHSDLLKNESINFPDNVPDLQELLLKCHEELIDATVAKETNEERVNTLTYEIQLLRDQMQSSLLQNDETASLNTRLREQLDFNDKKRSELEDLVEKLIMAGKKSEEQIKTLKSNIDVLKKEKKQYEQDISELRVRVGSLQQDLDTSETVQKDFVKLSQSLQIELEKIRGADSEVRWQHDEDAVECTRCRRQFTGGAKKDHCRHCGKICCSSCLCNTVLSGPNNRPSRVCHVCHTLLNRETAPYFSQKPPHLPD